MRSFRRRICRVRIETLEQRLALDATETSWVGNNGTWSDANHWNPDVPINGETSNFRAIVDLNGTRTITVADNTTIDEFEARQGTTTLDVSSAELRVDSGKGTISVGVQNAEKATLEILDGDVTAKQVNIGLSGPGELSLRTATSFSKLEGNVAVAIGGAGTFNMNQNTRWSGERIDIGVGRFVQGTLNMTGATVDMQLVEGSNSIVTVGKGVNDRRAVDANGNPLLDLDGKPIIVLGGDGRGTLSLSANASLKIHQLEVATQPNAQGTLLVTGGSVLDVRTSVIIGGGDNNRGAGNGTATISGTGSQLNSGGDLSVAFGDGSRGNLLLDDSAILELRGEFQVASHGSVSTSDGDSAVGSLTVQNGARISSPLPFAMYVGRYPTDRGTVFLSGATTSSIGTLNLGDYGFGGISVGNETTLEVFTVANIGMHATLIGNTVQKGLGLLSIDGGHLVDWGPIYAGMDERGGQMATGVIKVTNNGSISARDIVLGAEIEGAFGRGILDLSSGTAAAAAGENPGAISVNPNGILSGNGTALSDVVVTGGSVRPGDSVLVSPNDLVTMTEAVGTLTVNHDFRMRTLALQDEPPRPKSELYLNLNDPGPGAVPDPGTSYDQVRVDGGVAWLDEGVIKVNLGAGYTPAVGQHFDVVVADNVVANLDKMKVEIVNQGLSIGFTKSVVDLGNGTKAFRLTVVAKAADIQIDGFSPYGDGRQLYVNYTIDTNSGPDPFSIAIAQSADGTTVGGTLQVLTIDDPALLQPGSYQYVFQPNWSDTSGDYYIMAVADTFDEWSETSETNNTALFSGGLFLSGTTLHIQGTDSADKATVSQSGGGFSVTYGGVSRSYDLTDIDSIAARLHGNNDTLTGTSVDRVMRFWGGAGNDTGYGGSGNDTFWGGAGADTFFGYGGADQLNGEGDDDYLWGGAGNDYLSGGGGADHAYGQENDDTVDGGADGDYLEGNDGNDTLYGQAGNDSAYGGDGNDTLFGGDDADALWGGYGADSIEGGLGNDYIVGDDWSENMSLDGADTLHGNDGNDTIYAGYGGDSLFGDEGDDLRSHLVTRLDGVRHDLQARATICVAA